MDHRIVTAGSGASALSENGFLSRVYLWMSAGLVFSACSAFWLLGQPHLMRALYSNTILLIGLVIVELVMVVWLSRAALTMSAPMGASLFLVYSFLNGLTLASIFVIYTSASIVKTFAITAGTFAFFSAYGMSTKRDLTSVGSLAVVGLFGVILASLVNLFLKSPAVEWIVTYVGIAVFLGLIAYDTQKLKAMHAMAAHDAEMGNKASVLGALALYLDFINLFLLLLRVFGRQRD
jgi:uncharacterized protein